MNKDLPKQTIVQAFIIRRVPLAMPITRSMLIKNVEQDIKDSVERCGFQFADYSRRATPSRTLNFILERCLLTEKSGLISRNDRTKRYVARLPEKVVNLIDSLPVCDPLILLAGAGN